MSAREKSDLRKVAEKRANEVASAAAELVERRGGAKENAEEAGPLAPPGPAWLDGLLRGANERLGNLSIPASHDRTLAQRADASKPTTSTYVDENEEDR